MVFQRVPKEELLKYRYPDPALKEQYKVLNFILIGIVGVFVIFRVLLYKTIFIELVTGGISGSNLQTTGGIIFLLNTAMIILLIWIIKLLFSFDARAYMLLIILSIFSISNITKLDILSIVLVIVSLGLSLFLKKKLFPNVPIFGYVPKQ